MAANNLESERKELNQLCRELLLAEGELERIQKKLNRIEARKNTLYLEIDKKLDEG